MLLPEPAKNADGDQMSLEEELGKHTFAADPQERASGLPFPENTAFKEPFCRSSEMNVARNVVVYCWIWWSDPSPKALS